MKRVILIVFAVVLVVVGLVSATAFEGHMVDVRAHVENALWVDPYDINYGNFTFPQESIDAYLRVGLTTSFLNAKQLRLCDVKYVLIWEPKPIAGHLPVPGQQTICDPDGDGNFTDIYPYILVTAPADGDGLIDAANTPGWAMGHGAFAWGTLDKCLPDNCDKWGLKFDVPVFEGYYNPDTDPVTPSGVLTPDEYCLVEEDVGEIASIECPKRKVLVPHADLGNTLKFQVVGYSVPQVD